MNSWHRLLLTFIASAFQKARLGAGSIVQQDCAPPYSQRLLSSSHSGISSNSTAPLYTLSASQALGLIKENAISVEEYALSLLQRIEERDGIIQAWTFLDPAFIISQARALDQVPHDQRGPLHGIPIGIKDTMNTKDMPTQFGSPIYEGHRSGFDSSAVAILRTAGALIFGKTTTTEFTVANSGPNTTNPHDPDRTPGGSSSGSAAAVADMQIPISLGAQTGGSIIRPASFTGIFAMKPTHNAISTEGQKTFSPTFDTFGFFARSVDDLKLVADVFDLKDDDCPQETLLENVSVALMKTPMWPSAGSGTIAAMEKAAELLQKSGVHVQEVPFPPEIADAETLKRMQKVIMAGEGQPAFLREYRANKTRLDPEIRDMVENTLNYTHRERMDAIDRYATFRHTINNIAQNYSVILTPSAVDEAPIGLGDMGSPAFNTLWTGFHMPVVNIPAFTGDHDMPIGISLVCSRFHDQQLLEMSKLLENFLMAGDMKS